MTSPRPSPLTGSESTTHSSTATGNAVEVVRSEERLRVGTTTSELRRVRVSRRIVTETVTVEVQVRREELVVEELPVTPGAPATTSPADPLVVVLRREVPQPTVRVEPYERVTLSVVRVDGEQQVSDTLRREVVDVVEP